MDRIITIWKKELKDTIRDRRTLMSMIIMPMVLMPLIIVGMGKFTASQAQKAEERASVIAIAGQASAPDLMEAIRESGRFEMINEDPQVSVEDDSADLGLIFPGDFSEKISSNQPAQITVVTNSTETSSQTAMNKLRSVLDQYNDQIIAERLRERGEGKDLLSGAVLSQQDLASENQMGGFILGLIIPMFIVIWAVVGGQYTAMDISAGEKERKTLETLLLTPAKKIEIVAGKFLAVATASFLSVAISITSLFLVLNYYGPGILAGMSGAPGLQFSLEPVAIGIFFLVSLLLVLMFSALLLAISIFAKSFKEAQSYIGPAYILVVIPVALVNSIPGFEPAAWMFATPAINAVLLFKEVLVGTYNSSHIILTSMSSALYAVVAIYAAARIYSKEEVLFK